MEKMMFTIDDGKQYEGYRTSTRWNGWECPLFTKEVASQIIKDISDDDFYHAFYNQHMNRFIMLDLTNSTIEAPEVYYSQTAIIDGVPTQVYAIGAGSWRWDAVDWE